MTMAWHVLYSGMMNRLLFSLRIAAFVLVTTVLTVAALYLWGPPATDAIRGGPAPGITEEQILTIVKCVTDEKGYENFLESYGQARTGLLVAIQFEVEFEEEMCRLQQKASDVPDWLKKSLHEAMQRDKPPKI